MKIWTASAIASTKKAKEDETNGRPGMANACQNVSVRPAKKFGALPSSHVGKWGLMNQRIGPVQANHMKNNKTVH